MAGHILYIMECNGRYGCSFFRIFLSCYLVFKPSLFHKIQFVVSPSYRFHIFSLLLSRFINLPYFTQYILSFLSSHSRFFVFLLVTIFFLRHKPSSFHKLHFLVSSLLRESDEEQPLKILLSPSANLPFSYYPDGRSLLPSSPSPSLLISSLSHASSLPALSLFPSALPLFHSPLPYLKDLQPCTLIPRACTKTSRARVH